MEFKINNMLKTIGLVVLLFLTTGCVQKDMNLANQTEIEIESEVNQAFKGLIEAAKSLNVDLYLSFLDKQKFTSLNEDGSVFHNFSDFENMFRQQIPFLEKYESLLFENVKITVINRSTAVLVNEYIAEVVLKSGDTVSASGAGTQVWSKESGSWKLVNISGSMKTEN